MADEEKTEMEEQPEEAAAAESKAEDQPEAEEAVAAPEAEEAVAAPVAEAAPADEEAAQPPGPKEIRRQKRSQVKGPAKPQRTPEERATERAEGRKRNAAGRRRHRASQRQRGGEPGTGTAPAERDAGPKKLRTGTVVSTKAAKTITVKIEVTRRHPTYEKVVRRSATLHAHDEAGQAQEGDVVRVVETRPLSRTKRWRLVEVLERTR